MNRQLTNVIRFFMDECIPPIIRDNKYFMYPFFYYAYKGRNIDEAMNFKKLVYQWTDEEYVRFYSNINTISRNRKTDLNEPSIEYIRKNLSKGTQNLLDVGCGKGYFLERLDDTNLDLHGCDIVEKGKKGVYTFHQGHVEKLPFADSSFDIVTCSHTLEHILKPEKAVEELKRVAKKQLIIVVPKQRYFYYTLDEHVNFFDFQERLTGLVGLKNFTCRNIWGDWVYIGYLD